MCSAAKSGRASFPSISGTDRFWLSLINRKSGSEPDFLNAGKDRVPEDEEMNRPVDLDLRALGPAWSALRKASGNRIGPIRTRAQYERMYRLLQSLVEIVGDDERRINARQAKALAGRFGVSAAVFL